MATKSTSRRSTSGTRNRKKSGQTATGSRKRTTTRRNPSALAKTNPTARRRSSVKNNPTTTRRVSRRARRNPETALGLITAGLGMGFAVLLYDVAINRFFPQWSGFIKAGTKIGGGYLMRSFGSRLPFGLGKYSKELSWALVLMGCYDVVNQYARSTVSEVFSAGTQMLPFGGGETMLLDPATAAEMGYAYPQDFEYETMDVGYNDEIDPDFD